MKTTFFKLVLPLVAVVMGLGAAVSTHAMEKKAAKSGSTLGYRHLTTIPCDPVKNCDQIPNFICKSVMGEDLYEWFGGNNCPTLLYNSLPN